MKKFIFCLSTVLFLGCQSTPGGAVTVSHAYPQGNCEEVGQVIGTSGSLTNAREKAMNDLKHEAALRSANYVRLLAVSAHGAATRGIAYRCR